MTNEPEVLILGGGPAGSAAAGLLARWGLGVVVVERALGGGGVAGADEQSLAESLPPSTRKVLAATGLLGVVEAGGFQPNGGNTALWGGEGRRDDFAGGATGFHVLRGRFDGLLREVAVGAGAEVVGGVARLPERVGDGEGWGVEVVLDGGDRVGFRPGWLLDCTGRAGVLARRHRVPETAAPTLAVIRRHENAAGWPNVDPTHALVESFERGWAWSVPTSERERHVAVMLDPELHAVMEDAEDLAAAFEAEVARTSLMRSITTPARPVGRAWAVTASMYTSSTFADGRALLVGDAASFVDPMSSYGVKKALASGWLAAVAVNTAIRDAEMAETAVEFFGRREQAMYRALRGGLAEHVAETGGGERNDVFWERRAEWLADHAGTAVDPNSPDGPDAVALRDDPEVRAAFHALRLGSGRLRAGRRDTVERPLVFGNRLRMAPALVTPRFPEGVRYFRDIDLLRIVHLAAASRNPGALYESYSEWAAREGLPPVDLANFIGVVALLVADGVLVPGGGQGRGFGSRSP
ncbi:MAG: tryptophan 7-halogenase [Gemmatimonadota bacterium]|nr:tryptophan 7-halogenase [Gemmatimonadota bacterium]MDE2984874.1 tryptophan 7-halogenase [Gemmatimonadota bacterium]